MPGHAPSMVAHRSTRVVGALAVTVLVIVSCTSREGSSDPLGVPSTQGATAPARLGGDLIIGVEGDLTTLDPAKVALPSELLIAQAVYDPLLTYVDGRLSTHLAEELEVSADLRTYTITLRRGVTFHDGSALTAMAIARHFERLADPRNGCRCALQLRQVESLTMPDGPDGRSVQFNLAAPNVAFPDLLAGPTGFIESPTSSTGPAEAGAAIEAVGTGPFILRVAGPEYRLEANDGYWGRDADGHRLPYLDQIIVRPSGTGEDLLHRLEIGEVDLIQTSDPEVMRRGDRPGLAVTRVPARGTTLVLFNTERPPFDDVRARRAVALALDRDLLNERAVYGMAVPSRSLFAHGSTFLTDESALVPDPDEARRLVSELGGLQFTLRCTPTPLIDRLVPHMEELMVNAGMDVTVQTADAASFARDVLSHTGRYEAACHRGTTFPDPDALRSSLTSDGGGNLVGYENREVDRLMATAGATKDLASRQEAYSRVQQILAAEVPLVVLLHDVLGYLHNEQRVGPLPPTSPSLPGAVPPALLHRARD